MNDTTQNSQNPTTSPGQAAPQSSQGAPPVPSPMPTSGEFVLPQSPSRPSQQAGSTTPLTQGASTIGSPQSVMPAQTPQQVNHSNPSPIPAVPSQVQPQSIPTAPTEVTNVVPPSPVDADATAKITLQDLYGPSQPQEIVNPAHENPDLANLHQNQENTVPQETKTEEPLRSTMMNPVSHVTSPSIQATAQAQVTHAPSQEDSGSSEQSGFPVPIGSIIKFVVGGLILLVVLLLAFGFISSLFNKKSDNGNVTLTYWGLWEDNRVMQSVLDDFHRQYPNVTVNYVKEDPKDYPQRLLTRIHNGTGPDIFRFHNTWITPLQGALLPLPKEVIDKNTFTQQYFPVIQQDLVKNGALYGIPLQIDTLSLFINKSIFDHAGAKAPTTWDQFITASKALTVKDPNGKIKTSGAAIGAYDNVTHAPDIISLLLLQNGASLDKLAGSQNANDAITFYTSFAKGDNNVWDSTLDPSILSFARGKAAMVFGYSYDYFTIKATAPDLQFEIDPVPHLANRDMTIASYWAEGVSSKTSHPKEAVEFMRFLAQKDTQTKLYSEEAKTRQFGEIYPRKDLAEGLKTNVVLAPFVSQAQEANSSFFAGETYYDDFNGVLNRYLANAINAVLGNTSVDSALNTLSQGVSSVFSQYVQQTQ